MCFVSQFKAFREKAGAFCPRPEEEPDVNKQTSHCAGLQLAVMLNLNGNIQLWDDDNSDGEPVF